MRKLVVGICTMALILTAGCPPPAAKKTVEDLIVKPPIVADHLITGTYYTGGGDPGCYTSWHADFTKDGLYTEAYYFVGSICPNPGGLVPGSDITKETWTADKISGFSNQKRMAFTMTWGENWYAIPVGSVDHVVIELDNKGKFSSPDDHLMFWVQQVSDTEAAPLPYTDPGSTNQYAYRLGACEKADYETGYAACEISTAPDCGGVTINPPIGPVCN